MNVQGFTGINTRDAMRKVREALGEDALITSSRVTERGVEIFATLEDDLPVKMPQTVGGTSSEPVGLFLLNEEGGSQESLSSVSADAGWSNRLLQEMRDMRALISDSGRQQAQEDVSTRLQNLLRQAGFSSQLSAEITASLPSGLAAGQWQQGELQKWLARQLKASLPALEAGDAVVDAGGVFALVGPTGCGKTTTTAKIAAGYVMRHGPQSLALISTDHYRVGAHAHLKEYAGLLGVDFEAVRPGQSLNKVLKQFAHKKTVLVDTVGLSQRDIRVMDQMKRLHRADQKTAVVLLLNASSHDETLEEVVKSYRQASVAVGCSLKYCIFTKLDEAHSPVPVIDRAIRYGLSALFTTAGQRVPEDLDQPEIMNLLQEPIEKMMRQQEAGQFSPQGNAEDWTRHLFNRGRQIGVMLGRLRAMVTGFSRMESLWTISLMHSGWQKSLLEAHRKQEMPALLTTRAMLWTDDRKLHGADSSCQALLLEPDCQPTCIGISGMSGQVSFADRLKAMLKVHGAMGAQLFQSVPETDVMAALEEYGLPWMCAVPANQEVCHEGDILGVAKLESACEFHSESSVQFRNSKVLMRLYRGRVGIPGDWFDSAYPGIDLWWAELVSPEKGAVLCHRHWLSSASLSGQNCARTLLAAEALPGLVRRASGLLESMHGFQSCADLRDEVATSMAFLALRLDMSSTSEASDLREQLMLMLGGKRQYSAKNLVDGLGYLFLAREMDDQGWIN